MRATEFSERNDPHGRALRVAPCPPRGPLRLRSGKAGPAAPAGTDCRVLTPVIKFDPLKAREAAFALIDQDADLIYAERFGASDAAKDDSLPRFTTW